MFSVAVDRMHCDKRGEDGRKDTERGRCCHINLSIKKNEMIPVTVLTVEKNVTVSLFTNLLVIILINKLAVCSIRYYKCQRERKKAGSTQTEELIHP